MSSKSVTSSLYEGLRLLNGRYILIERMSSGNGFELWRAEDDFAAESIIKVFAYQPVEHPENTTGRPRPNDVQRALWDIEFRNLMRLSSTPGSDGRVLTLIDAGIDTDNSHFVMVFPSNGHILLSQLLIQRSQCPWLSQISDPSKRARLWEGVRNLAHGLSDTHQQQILHRAISTESVFAQLRGGPESLRLGGFDSTVRLGSSFKNVHGNGDPTTNRLCVSLYPRGLNEAFAHSFESDWFFFGVMLGQLFAQASLPAGHMLSNGFDQQLFNTFRNKVRGHPILSDLEKDVICDLFNEDSLGRLKQPDEILKRIGDVVSRLTTKQITNQDSYLALVVQLGSNLSLTNAILESDSSIRSQDIDKQITFLEEDLAKATVISYDNDNSTFILRGIRLNLKITEFERGNGRQASGEWLMAYCLDAAQVTRTVSENGEKALPFPVKIYPRHEARRSDTRAFENAVSWRPFLRLERREYGLVEKLQILHEFFRVTNQIDLLMLDAEIFPYEFDSDDYRRTAAAEFVTIRARINAPAKLSFVDAKDMHQAVARLIEEKSGIERQFLLTDQARLNVPNTRKDEAWEVVSINNDGTIELRRQVAPNRKTYEPPRRGFLRSWGMSGQVKLFRRRRSAIERLQNHSFLLRSLLLPSSRYMNVGSELPLPINPDDLDEAKQTALRSIWRTRPIFALQGPPGTGKTTLVAHLLGQIFEDDPVGQVLVTAQAHAAVDVLKEQVKRKIYKGRGDDDLPLSIRLSIPTQKDSNRPNDGIARGDSDYVEDVTLNMLVNANQRIGEGSPIQDKWKELLILAISELETGVRDSLAGDMIALVKRSANITYSTTTSGDLAVLAETTQSFDWSIVEEAGKAHGFDMVLPLHLGHRWLLIGDQFQLPPYRAGNFDRALDNLDDVIRSLRTLPDARDLVDYDLIRGWAEYNSDQKAERLDSWKKWLKFFKQVFHESSNAVEVNDTTDSMSAPPLAQMLSWQHRMHPDIAQLISKAYYRGRLMSKATDEEKQHPFSAPGKIKGKAIVWIDIPWQQDEMAPKGQEVSFHEQQAVKVFLESLEADEPIDGWSEKTQLDLAVLSPYRQQVHKLTNVVKAAIYETQLPAWLWPQHPGQHPASTVDSFQGNQAGIVVVSLVRNNGRNDTDGAFGFLREQERMNVLLSRAEKLLVLVGSWDFFRHHSKTKPTDPDRDFGDWRIAIDYIETCFSNGKAVKLTFDPISGQLN